MIIRNVIPVSGDVFVANDIGADSAPHVILKHVTAWETPHTFLPRMTAFSVAVYKTNSTCTRGQERIWWMGEVSEVVVRVGGWGGEWGADTNKKPYYVGG